MDRPKIGEKVKFWEEQDKINQAIIPRILEMHENLKATALLSENNSSRNLTLSIELKELTAKLDKIAKDVEKIKNKSLTQSSKQSYIPVFLSLVSIAISVYIVVKHGII